MGSRERPLFDLNELPTEEEDEKDDTHIIQPQKSIPTPNPSISSLFQPSDGSPGIINNHAFRHASSSSGFQPFVRCKENDCLKQTNNNLNAKHVSTVPAKNSQHNEVLELVSSGSQDSQAVEKEEGEWSDMEDDADALPSTNSKGHGAVNVVTIDGNNDYSVPGTSEVGDVDKEMKFLGADDGTSKENVTAYSQEPVVLKHKHVKGVEANHAMRVTNNSGKKPKFDEHKEAMLGKKRARQTVFINLEDAKQAGSMKISTPKRQASLPARIVKDISRAKSPVMNESTIERRNHPIDQKHSNRNLEGRNSVELKEQRSEPNGDTNPGSQCQNSRLNRSESLPEICPPTISKQGSSKHSTESSSGHINYSQVPPTEPAVVAENIIDPKLVNKKHLPPKKPISNNLLCQDTSVERLIREVTNDMFWHQKEETELQCVPGSFTSVEEYVSVFEPLLFEECRAQLYSTWEECNENSKDAFTMVHVKNVERRERGWYDIIVIPAHEGKWTFKEGDLAVLSYPRPATVIHDTKNTNDDANKEDTEPDITGRVVGTIRSYVPTDTRDLLGAILHFFIGDSCDSSSKVNGDNILGKFQPGSIWYLRVLGSLATTQREYIALHAFRRLNLQMQTAILKPSPEYFPKYEEQPPAMPECFTPRFVEHLHRSFNGPQLVAIQWAAMHTAAGTSNGLQKRPEPWPFTLVQGPPGTGKTHTVWGMLNVIHLVQYQHYYTALLKQLAPESYKQSSDCSSESVSTGSIDEVLHNMDRNLFRTLPKLSPKPRMLVCAPSNAATDELLARVLDCGFIDGEMSVYRPDVARVGMDSQTRAAQAVSVERRTEQLLLKGREEVMSLMQQLIAHESQFSQQISHLQRQLNVAAAAGRSQGSVGVYPDVLIARDQNRDVLLRNLARAVEARDKLLVEMSRLGILESRFRPASNFNLEDARAQLEASFANEAEIVFTTVSSSGRKILSRLSHGFDMVVIDEAAQASEVAVLPPLSLGAARCVLVGDPQQLPATVISKAAGTLLYSRSLFERFQQAGCPTMLLSVQYRMHPQIRDFPSRYFYRGCLTDSESVANLADEVYYKDPLLQPYAFYDISHGQESQQVGSVSYQNFHEAQFCLRIYEHLHKFLKSNGGRKVSIGIITPYKLQLKCLQREFKEILSSEEGKDLYINTVDAFQGQERDVIIMSCVRGSNHGVGFVADIRRMNVALTRARRALWVVGNATALMQSDDWAAMIADAKSRNCFMDMERIPKELLVLKACTYTAGNNTRNLRAGGQRQKPWEVHSQLTYPR